VLLAIQFGELPRTEATVEGLCCHWFDPTNEVHRGAVCAIVEHFNGLPTGYRFLNPCVASSPSSSPSLVP
jgi:hypothetical protein